MQLNPRQLSHVLAVWPVARLASIGPQRRPHVVPIVFVDMDGVIHSPIDGKPKRSGVLQRVRNVARSGSVSLLLDHYDADWRLLWWLRIDAMADVVSSTDVPTPDLAGIARALQQKYAQYRSIEVFSGMPTLLRLVPRCHTAWSAQPIEWEALKT